MYNFQKVRTTKESRVQLDYKWMLKIDSVQALVQYMFGVDLYSDALENFITSTEKDTHFSNALTASISKLVDINGFSFTDNMTNVSNAKSDMIHNLLSQGKIVYINENGGFFYNNHTEEYGKPKSNEKLLFPKALSKRKVKYLQWKDGTHWYAKVDKIDVVDKDQNQKWDTKAEARKAVKEWLTIN